MKFSNASEILRSYQKDDLYSKQLSDETSDVLLKILGSRLWIRYKDLFESSAQFAYFLLTTLAGYQTLGEEYCGIVQVEESKFVLPSRLRRLISTFCFCYGPLGLKLILQKLHKFIQDDDQIVPTARENLLLLLSLLKETMSIIQRLNLGLFYIHGLYYSLSKRLTSIRYVSLQKHRFDWPTFRYLGCLSFVSLVISSWNAWRRFHKTKESASVKDQSGKKENFETSEKRSSEKCPLCLEWRMDTSCTPCGHLFCWNCIMQSLNMSPECPICREPIQKSRVVPVMNYD